MAKNRIKLIVNPNADRGNAWQYAADLRPIVETHGGADWAGTVYPTHATELAKQAAEEGFELIVAVGGDGTVHEVVNGLMQVPADKRPILGVVPIGSGNDFANNIGISSQPETALNQVLTGKPSPVDIGVIEDQLGRHEYWDNTINIGFGGTTTIRSRQLPVIFRGFLLYFTAVVQTILFNHDVLTLDISADQNNWTEELMMLALCNGPREGGGFDVAPDADPEDGVFNYTIVKKVSRLMMFRLLPEFMRGTQGNFKQISMDEFKKIEVKSNKPLYLHTDGEIFAGFGTDIRQLRVEILPKALQVIRP